MTTHPHLTRRQFLRTSATLAALSISPSLFAADSPKTKIKLGAVDWELTKPADPAAIAVAARLGFDGLQVDLGDVKSFTPERQQRHIALAKEHKIEIASLALGVLNDIPLASDTRAPALVDQALDIAKSMNQKVILLAFFGKGDLNKPANKPDELVARLKALAPKAEKLNITLALEAEISVDRYKAILDRVASPAVQVYFDTVHAHTQGASIYDEITSLKGRIAEFHAKDYSNILFAQGKTDFKALRRAIDATNFSGWIHLEQWAEIQGPKPLGFDQTHRQNLQYLRELFPAA